MRTQSKVIIALLFLTAIVLAIAYVSLDSLFLNGYVGSIRHQIGLNSLWKERNYNDLIIYADDILENNPLNINALFYGGISHFYTSLAAPSRQDQLTYLNISIEYLRRALVHSRPPQLSKIYYILSQAYYHKGEFYYDVSIDYMQQAIDEGYIGDQSYEYLGAAHTKIGDYQKGIEYFQIALANGDESSQLLIAMAETYYLVQDYYNALETIHRLEQHANGEYEKQRVQLLYAKIYIANTQFQKAENILTDFLEKNPRSAEAHFLLGQYYQAVNAPDKARFQWRTAFRLDPEHTEALQSLQNQ